MTLKIVIFIGLVAVVLSSRSTVYEDDGDNGPLSNNCIRCICKVLGCPRRTPCKSDCGPFYITYGYWRDAFYRGDNEQAEYRKCTSNVWCSVRTVQAHMQRFLPKCVGDSGSRDVCETALALHMHGQGNCTVGLKDRHKNDLAACLDKLAWNWLNV